MNSEDEISHWRPSRLIRINKIYKHKKLLKCFSVRNLPYINQNAFLNIIIGLCKTLEP